VGFSIGPLFDALGAQLVTKRNLGIHSPFFTDALMDLVKSGAVSNRQKRSQSRKMPGFIPPMGLRSSWPGSTEIRW